MRLPSTSALVALLLALVVLMISGGSYAGYVAVDRGHRLAEERQQRAADRAEFGRALTDYRHAFDIAEHALTVTFGPQAPVTVELRDARARAEVAAARASEPPPSTTTPTRPPATTTTTRCRVPLGSLPCLVR